MMTITNLNKYIFFFLLVLLAGCSAVGPDYERPEVDKPADWMNKDSIIYIDSTDRTAADTAWWRLFGDTILTNLIHTALVENADIKIAAARVEQYLAYYGVSKSEFYPEINARSSYSYGKLPSIDENNTDRKSRGVFRLDIAADWELDLWGRIRRLNESARADVLASEESRQAMVLFIASKIASSYIDLLMLKQQLEISKQTVESRENARRLFALRYEKGEISLVEVNQLESDYWNVKSKVPEYEKLIAQAENNINVLIGRNPGFLQSGKLMDSLNIPMIPAGLPSSLLERRPDIRNAEQILISANANIGAVKAQYYPTISLSGTLGLATQDLKNILEPTSQLWNIGANLIAPLFNAGRISSQVEVAEAVKKQALIAYVNTVRNAFRDVENSLLEYDGTREQLEYLGNRVNALSIYTNLSIMNFNEGVSSYLEVLDAERTLFDTQINYYSVKSNLMKSIVAIYSSLAGGWVTHASMQSVQPEGKADVEEIKNDQ
ncbi:MAG: Multidrug/solvent efflux pump outer membrane protein MepC [Ignavibacteria bacterium]|nr:Multidrug/solvent efflux pump outer membrane protein MepC [Ignavibacteria bacterium]